MATSTNDCVKNFMDSPNIRYSILIDLTQLNSGIASILGKCFHPRVHAYAPMLPCQKVWLLLLNGHECKFVFRELICIVC
ncbi:hypothetical protein L596_028914 [Steinernema carpocapsae]|uniref:Uncharacterized protein n=1 Tax=Steinernema carpocapsae TaxID=34508 RepID=A0A4U5LZR3_STECR|nr:hypothetical protein L596_028914 [Steinernema carpocapsae]